MKLPYPVCCSLALLVGACQVSPVDGMPTEAEVRTIDHALGETDIIRQPQRVIALEACAMEHVLALGIQPVAVPHEYRDYAYVAEQVAQHQPHIDLTAIADIGVPPNLETAVRLAPDLMVGENYGELEALYPQLQQIAPTVVTPFDSGAQWQESLRLMARAANRVEVAEAVIARYDEKLSRFKAQMGAQLDDIEVSAIALYDDGFGLYQRYSFIGSILAEAGLQRPPSQNLDRSQLTGQFEHVQVRISRERIPDIEADVILILGTDYPGTEDLLSDLQADPLWQSLNAVQQNNVHKMGLYGLSCGPLAAHAVVDDLFKIFVDKSPP